MSQKKTKKTCGHRCAGSHWERSLTYTHPASDFLFLFVVVLVVAVVSQSH